MRTDRHRHTHRQTDRQTLQYHDWAWPQGHGRVKTHTATKHKSSNCDKTQKLKLWQLKPKLWKNSNSDSSISDRPLVRTTWHLDNRVDVLWAAFCCDLAIFFFLSSDSSSTSRRWEASTSASSPTSLRRSLGWVVFCTVQDTLYSKVYTMQ